MNSEELAEWARQLQEEAYLQWRAIQPEWRPGFMLFFSPVKFRPNLLILSLQPGGGREYFHEDLKAFQSGQFGPPLRNVYVDHPNLMAQQVRGLVGDELPDSMALPIIFFRASNLKAWRTECETAMDLERYSVGRAIDIIKMLQPREILCLGIATYDILVQHWTKRHYREIQRNDPNFMLGAQTVLRRRGGADQGPQVCSTGRIGNVPVFICKHPTGARWLNEDRDAAQQIFRNRARRL